MKPQMKIKRPPDEFLRKPRSEIRKLPEEYEEKKKVETVEPKNSETIEKQKEKAKETEQNDDSKIAKQKQQECEFAYLEWLVALSKEYRQTLTQILKHLEILVEKQNVQQEQNKYLKQDMNYKFELLYDPELQIRSKRIEDILKENVNTCHRIHSWIEKTDREREMVRLELEKMTNAMDALALYVKTPRSVLKTMNSTGTGAGAGTPKSRVRFGSIERVLIPPLQQSPEGSPPSSPEQNYRQLILRASSSSPSTSSALVSSPVTASPPRTYSSRTLSSGRRSSVTKQINKNKFKIPKTLFATAEAP